MKFYFLIEFEAKNWGNLARLCLVNTQRYSDRFCSQRAGDWFFFCGHAFKLKETEFHPLDDTKVRKAKHMKNILPLITL